MATIINKESAPSGVFVSTLAAMHAGKVLTDLDDALREVTRSVNDSQKKGKLTLELVIMPNGLGAGETPLFKLDEKVKVTLPKKPRPSQSFFADEENNLTRRNPNQDEMKLSVVHNENSNSNDKAPNQKTAQ